VPSASTTVDRPQLGERLEAAYQKVVDSSNPFLVPLSFNEGIATLCEGLNRRVVLLFDEFDEPFGQIESRVFLNLRALKDRYDRRLCYVVATGRPLEKMRQGSETGEFCEMFAHRRLWLGPMVRRDTDAAVTAFMAREDATPSARDLDFVWRQAGGHPGLVTAVCHVLVAVGGGESDQGQDLARALVQERLASDPGVQSECVKLWNGLEAEAQGSLIDFVSGRVLERSALAPLLRNGLLREGEAGTDLFGALFGGFVRRQRLAKSPYPLGVRVDADSGEVWVDGRRAPTLTELEYRLLLLLYGRIDRICDKYQIVEAVWGQAYIDQVDDARIEKLVSRLRKKIEPDPGEPRYVQTVRGRGYRLMEA
jgi:DNA-binding winged helix-turn-helix (wHTH) protein